MTIICFEYSPELCGHCSGKWLLVLLITKTLDFNIRCELHSVYQAACYITGTSSFIYTFFMRNCFTSSPGKVKKAFFRTQFFLPKY